MTHRSRSPVLVVVCAAFALTHCDSTAPPPTRAAPDVEAGAPADITTLAPPSPASATTPRDASTSPPPPPPAPEGMLLVPGGTFTMGAEKGGEEDERPAHAVTVAPFFLDKLEVSNEAYAACVAAKVCRAKAKNEPGFSGPRQPVDYIAWDDAKKYCEWRGKRLPREAEFERAVRGDDGRKFPWGNERPTPDKAVYNQSFTMDVGSKPAGRGPYGHEDLTGNVWEWMDDEYDPFAYTRPTAPEGKPGSCAEILAAQNKLRAEGKQGFTGSNPIPTECEHAIRGGAYNFPPEGLRSTNRVHHAAHFKIPMLGVRCALSLPP